MTPTHKQRVLRVWPDAECFDYDITRRNKTNRFSVEITRSDRKVVSFGTGPTPAAAWRDAAERMK